MSSSVTDPTSNSNNTTTADTTVASPDSKGKGKAPAVDEPMEDDGEDEEDEEEDEGDDDGEEDEEDEEETLDEIDPSAIVTGGRRTRGVRVDYASQEALEKAGLKPDEEDDDEDDDVDMQ